MQQFMENYDFDPYPYFHFHIYFKNAEERERALELAQQLIHICKGEYNKPVDKPIGPHPYPMIEVDIGKNMRPEDRKENFVHAVRHCMVYSQGLSILVHPIGAGVDPLSAHTLEAIWFGPQLEIDKSIF